MFEEYCLQKREGNSGQQAKAVRMLESRKIVSVKTLSDENDVNRLFVRALVNPSFGHNSRPAVLLFVESKPVKGCCSCPVGPSGICCHVLALMLFLKHYHETGETLLELTCTQVLQKWHKRSKKGSVPMVPLSQLKVKAAKLCVNNGKRIKIDAADPNSQPPKSSRRNIQDQKNYLRLVKP